MTSSMNNFIAERSWKSSKKVTIRSNPISRNSSYCSRTSDGSPATAVVSLLYRVLSELSVGAE
jgi:hypothetical protein